MINEDKAKTYCCEDISLIENYNLAIIDSDKWVCHHRWGISPVGIFSHEYLDSIGLYYNRPACELIFMKEFDHRSLHKRNPSEETRMKLSESISGKNNYWYGKKFSEEHKKKIGEAGIGRHHSESTRKKCSELMDWKKTPIIAFKDGEYIGEYESQMEASRMLNLDASKVNAVVNKKRRQHKGYTFEYKKKELVA